MRILAFGSFCLAALAGPDSAKPTRILYIGDSHTAGAFGKELDQKLQTIPQTEVTSYGSCGSRFGSWYSKYETPCGFFEHLPGQKPHYKKTAPTPKLRDLFKIDSAKYGRKITIVELGANSIGLNYEKEKAALAQMAKDIRASGSECIVVGPPKMRKFTEKQLAAIYKMYEEGLKDAGCQVIDSREFKGVDYPARGGDGLHYDSFKGGAKIARDWADLVFDAMTPLIAIDGMKKTENATGDAAGVNCPEK